MYGLKLLVTEDSLIVRKESMPWKQTILKIFEGKKKSNFLVAQWIRICLPKKRTALWSMVPEDSTCHGATRPTWHNFWAHVPQLLKPTSYSAHKPQLLSLCAATAEACMPKSPHSAVTTPCVAATTAWAPRAYALKQEKLPQWEACALQQRVAKGSPHLPQPEKACLQQEWPSTTTNKYR